MNSPYTRRADGKIAVTLDNNVWDFLFERNVDLAAELRADKFALFITREVEIEGMAIKTKKELFLLEEYIRNTIKVCNIRTTSVFGFQTADVPLQRLGGFGQGAFQSQTEREFYALIRDQYLLGKSARNSGLTHNEADAAVAAQSFFSIALTKEKPNKPGPLRVAAEHGGKVLYLKNFDQSGLSLKDFIDAFHQRT